MTFSALGRVCSYACPSNLHKEMTVSNTMPLAEEG